jgi:hypothetical protein
VQILRYTSLAFCIGSAAASIWYYTKRYEPAQEKLEDLSDADKNEICFIPQRIGKLQKRSQPEIGFMYRGAGWALFGAGFFALSFAF